MKVLIFEAALSEREVIFQALKQAGHQLYLAQLWPLTWEAPYLEKKGYWQIDVRPAKWPETKKMLVKKCKELGVEAVAVFNDGMTSKACELQQELGLDPISYCENVDIFRNKYQMRQRFYTSGFELPESLRVLKGEDNLENKLSDFEKRCSKLSDTQRFVVKPTELMSSVGVSVVPSPLANQLDAIKHAHFADLPGEDLRGNYEIQDDVIVEAYVPGQEYSLEVLVHKGDVVFTALTEKYTGLDNGIQEIAHITGQISSFEGFQMSSSDVNLAIDNIIRGFNFYSSALHFEFKVCESKLIPIEIGARVGGDHISESISHLCDYPMHLDISLISCPSYSPKLNTDMLSVNSLGVVIFQYSNAGHRKDEILEKMRSFGARIFLSTLKDVDITDNKIEQSRIGYLIGIIDVQKYEDLSNWLRENYVKC